jgi:hypothetical protein
MSDEREVVIDGDFFIERQKHLTSDMLRNPGAYKKPTITCISTGEKVEPIDYVSDLGQLSIRKANHGCIGHWCPDCNN